MNAPLHVQRRERCVQLLKNPVSQPKRAAFSRFSDQAVPIRTILGVNRLPVFAEEGFNEIHPLNLGSRNIANVENAVKEINSVTELANQSDEAFNEIVQMIDQASDQVRSIATSSEEQSAASEQINRSVEQIAGISNENAEAMRQSSAAVSELSKQSQILKSLIDQMKSGS